MLKYSNKFIRSSFSSFQVCFFKRLNQHHFEVVFYEEEFNFLQEKEYLWRLAFIKYIYVGKTIANRNISEPAGWIWIQIYVQYNKFFSFVQ
jgi:hypothetical protein